MERLRRFGTMVSVGMLLLAPSSAVAGNGFVGPGEPVVANISFETTAPYYEPPLAVVSAGMPIRWSNSTASPHSIRHDGCVTDGPCAFSSIAVPPDDSFAIAPLPPGRYAYHCELHPVMRGTLVVVESQITHEGATLDPTR